MTFKSRQVAISSKNLVGKLVFNQNNRSITNRVEDEANEVSEEEAYAKPVKDVSMKIFILQKLIMLSGNSIIADTDFVKFEEFDYHQFE